MSQASFVVQKGTVSMHAPAQVGIRHGVGDNGKWVCGLRTLLKRSPCIVYSFGCNGETSFEQDILRATKCARLPAESAAQQLLRLCVNFQGAVAEGRQTTLMQAAFLAMLRCNAVIMEPVLYGQYCWS